MSKLSKVLGFEIHPKGKLLSQFIDFESDGGVAYERCIGYNKDFHVHDRINLTFPRASSLISFKIPDGQRKLTEFIVDDRSFLWMPPQVEHSQDTKSTVYDNLAIFPTETLVKKLFRKFLTRYENSHIELPRHCVKKKRSILLDELLNEYFIERVIERKDEKHFNNLLEQILNEVFRILCQQPKFSNRKVDNSFNLDAVSKAIRFIEANLEFVRS